MVLEASLSLSRSYGGANKKPGAGRLLFPKGTRRITPRRPPGCIRNMCRLLVRAAQDHPSADHSQLRWSAADWRNDHLRDWQAADEKLIYYCSARGRNLTRLKSFTEIMQCGWLATTQFSQSIAACHHTVKKIHHRIWSQQCKNVINSPQKRQCKFASIYSRCSNFMWILNAHTFFKEFLRRKHKSSKYDMIFLNSN
jgi:hypothetical protein